ncbi:MAG: FHA domain-containing protein [Anaerolineae bacterium]|nr:FHA domain-containing protein [Anaerolineae bacterium]
MFNPMQRSVNALLMLNDHILPIAKIITTMGRSLENDMVIQNPSVSRHHAHIRYEESQFVLYDLDSTAGTYINDQRTIRAVLFSGDIIRLGTVSIEFLMEGALVTHNAQKATGALEGSEEEITEQQAPISTVTYPYRYPPAFPGEALDHDREHDEDDAGEPPTKPLTHPFP